MAVGLCWARARVCECVVCECECVEGFAVRVENEAEVE